MVREKGKYTIFQKSLLFHDNLTEALKGICTQESIQICFESKGPWVFLHLDTSINFP